MSYPQPRTPEEKLADAKKQLGLPRIVAICGSTRFMTEMNVLVVNVRLSSPSPRSPRAGPPVLRSASTVLRHPQG